MKKVKNGREWNMREILTPAVSKQTKKNKIKLNL